MKRIILFLSLAVLPAAGLLFSQNMVSGYVAGAEGEALPGAHVYVVEARQGVYTNEKGFYQLEGLAPGVYTIRATFMGYERTVETLVMPQGGAITLNLQLTREAIRLEELTVTATRAGSRTPITYKNMGKEELESHNMGQDVPYLLRFTPSLVETSDAGNGIGYTGLRIRGSDPTRINVTINGIPLNDAESQGVYWVNMPDFSSSVEDIQIQRGVGTSTNGPGAFGASINLNTNKVRREPYAQIAGSAGSFNTWRSSAQFGSGLLNERFTLEGRLSKIHSDGYVDRASADLSSYYLSGAWIGKRSTLRFNLFSGKEVTYQAWYGIPGEYLADPSLRTFNPSGTEKEGEPYDNEVDNYGQTHYQLLFSHAFSPRWDLSFNGHYTRGLGYYEQYKADQDLASYSMGVGESDLIRRLWLDNHFYGITYALRYLTDDSRLNWTLGGAANRYLGDHYGDVIWSRFAGNSEIRHRFYENEAEKSDLNAFSKLEYLLPGGLSAYIDLQYRTVSYQFLGFDRQGANVTQSENLHFFNPKAGLFWKVSKNASAYGSFAVGHREPNRNDYTESSPDSRPRPERMLNTELGYQRNWNTLAFNANLYHMYYQDQLILTGRINDVGEYTRINVPASFRMGLELEGQWQSRKGWAAQVGATMSRNRILDYTEYLDDFLNGGQVAIFRGSVPMAFSPSLIGMAQLTYDLLWKKEGRSLEAALMHKYVGRQFLENGGADLPAYFYGDFRIAYSQSFQGLKRVELSALAANIWNRLYASNGWVYRYAYGEETFTDAGYYPQAGRNFLISLKIDL